MAEDFDPLSAIDICVRSAYFRLESAYKHHSRWSASSPYFSDSFFSFLFSCLADVRFTEMATF